MRYPWRLLLCLWTVAALLILNNAGESWAWWGVGIWLLLGALGGILLELTTPPRRPGR